ncbi:MAG: DHHW family protein [Eubacteriales bacterium]
MLKTRILPLLLLAVLLLVSCTGGKIRSDIPTETLLTAALTAVGGHEGTCVYFSTAAEDEDGYIEPGYAGQIFRGEYGAPLADDGVIEEYALCIPEGLYAFEIDIFKAADEDGVQVLLELLGERTDAKEERRSEMLHYLGADPAAADEEKALDNMELVRMGNYVMLFATTDNRAAKNAVSSLLGASVGEDVSGAAETTAAAPHETADTSAADTEAKDTEAPADENFTMTITSHSAPDRVVLGGTCTPGAKIVVTGTPKDHTFGTDDGFWLCEVEIFTDGETELSVSQLVEDRISDPFTVTAAYDPDVDFSGHTVYAVVVGDNMQGFFVQQIDDWTGANVLSSAGKTKIKNAVSEKVSYLNENADGAKLVYLIVPDQMCVYPETVPERYARSDKPETRKEQFVSAAREAGAIVVDLYDVMTAHRDDTYKIYHKTDSHWTDYGAYLGYAALMETIAADFPDAAPLPIDGNFRFYKQVVTAGDMMTHLEIPNRLLSENCTFVEWLNDLPNNPPLYMDGKNELDFTPVRDGQKTVNPNTDGKTLPRAMIIRDSFSANLFGYVNQSFAEISWRPMWDYSFSKVEISRFMPDYVIYIVGEKTLGSILY